YEKGDAKIKSNPNKYEIKMNAAVLHGTSSFDEVNIETIKMMDEFSDMNLKKIHYGVFSSEDLKFPADYMEDNRIKNASVSQIQEDGFLVGLPSYVLEDNYYTAEEMYDLTNKQISIISGEGKGDFHRLPNTVKKIKYKHPVSKRTELLETYYVEFSGINEEYAPNLKMCTGQCQCNMKK
ncbi:MAG: hypothetical protein KAU95_01790, partial [Candidatus Aenigmarchaeota archaeon]|nr:hypothetical protein [Candidatus Aenigmarchaeota archaeon]